MNNTQSGIAHVLLVVIVVVVLGVAGYAGFRVMQPKDVQITSENAAEQAAQSPAKIKHLGFDLDYYDPATGKAGDVEFKKLTIQDGGLSAIFMEFGRVSPPNSASGGRERVNPQPTFLLPMGTKIRAVIDGEVVSVPTLYSNDKSVHIQAKGSNLIFEMEHVINVTVKVGDTVKAGDVVAEVSGYSAHNYEGLGLVELGILNPGNPPSHLCFFAYLDDSIKEDTLKKIEALQKAWEDYTGDPTIYDEAAQVTPGCTTHDPVGE